MPQGIEGSDPKDYPWSWMWLVVPNEDVQKVPRVYAREREKVRALCCCSPLLLGIVFVGQDIGIVFGTGRFGIGFPLYDVYGGYGAVGLPGNKHISGRFAKVRFTVLHHHTLHSANHHHQQAATALSRCSTTPPLRSLCSRQLLMAS